MDELSASLALRHTRGLGPRTWKRLLTCYGNARTAVANCSAWTARGLVSARVQAEFMSGTGREKAEKEQRRVEACGFGVVHWADPAYPDMLREIPDPPLYLYYLGDPSLLARPCVAVVGSRDASRYGAGMAESIAASLSLAGVCVVSGFAQGIDRAAHHGALRGVGGTVAVLGTGLDLVYPASNASLWKQISAHGLIVSEFSPGTRPESMNFPHRNRIVSGLSLGVLVVEGALGSGSLITAKLALAQNRDVFALPGPANMKTYQGCHQLIRQGACLVQSAEDILRELHPRLGAHLATDPPTAPVCPREPDDPEQQVLHRLLAGGEPVHIDTLGRRTGWAANKVSSTLLFMELKGIVKQLPGMYYALAT